MSLPGVLGSRGPAYKMLLRNDDHGLGIFFLCGWEPVATSDSAVLTGPMCARAQVSEALRKHI